MKIQEINISNPIESKLIFGNLLENISDIILMNNVKEDISYGNINQANKNAIAAKRANVHPAELTKLQQDANNMRSEIIKKENKEKDSISGEKLKEDTSAVVASLNTKKDKIDNDKMKIVDNIDSKISNLQTQKEKINQNAQNKKEQIDFKINRIKAMSYNKENLKETKIVKNRDDAEFLLEQMGYNIMYDDVDYLLEKENIIISKDKKLENTVNKSKLLSNKLSKDLRNEPKHNLSIKDGKTLKSGKFDAMLFNGASGEILKYFIKNELNNNNSSNLFIYNIMNKDNEVQSIISKIKVILKKYDRGTAKDTDYTQLKILKSQFRQKYDHFKKQEENKYKK